MSTINDFMNILDALIQSLDNTNIQTALYFKKLREKIGSTKDPVELKLLLGQISKIGTIAQYGGLSPIQDQILTDLLSEASKLSKT